LYDISDTKQRSKVHKAILPYMVSGQRSVYECILKPEELMKLQLKFEQLGVTSMVQFFRLDQDFKREYYVIASSQNQQSNSILII
jgi:CRISPR-associated protein Cas2